MKSIRILLVCSAALLASVAIVRAETKVEDKKTDAPVAKSEKACCTATPAKSCCEGEGAACCKSHKAEAPKTEEKKS